MTNIPVNERRNWLGASEVAALFGVHPQLTEFELWHQKVGNIPPPDLDRNERVNAGQFLEPSIAAWASHKWHWPIRNVAEYLAHPHVARMGASLDFEALDGLEPVEIKNVDFAVFRDGEWETEGDEVLDGPSAFMLQVQHQLACRPGPDRGWLIPCVGGNRLYRMEIPRHDKLIGRIEAKVEAFWDSIAKGREPQPNFEADAEAIAQLYGGQGDEVVDLRDNDHFGALCEQYLAALEVEKDGATRKKATLAEIKTLMQDARCALGPEGFKVKAAHIKAATIARNEHWRFSVTHKKGN